MRRLGARQAIPPRRTALIAAAIILVYGLVIVLIPLAREREVAPPWWVYRPVALFGLFAVPAVVASIGARRGVRPLLVAAGVMCLLQAFIAFSGITLGFVVPAVLLLVLAGSDRWPDQRGRPRSAPVAAIAVVVLTIGAWVSLFAFTERRCYTISRTEGGALIATEVPATDSMTQGPVQISGAGSGCGDGELTVQGVAIGSMLAIGAIASAATAASAGRGPNPD